MIFCIGVVDDDVQLFLGFRSLIVVIFIERRSNDGYIVLQIDIVYVVIAIDCILRDGGFVTKFVQQYETA